MNETYSGIREQAFEANRALGQSGLVIHTFGNASALDRSLGCFAIKPSGVPYADLSPRAMVVVDLEGHVVEGSMNPSSDTLTHAVLYRAFTEISGIAHTHSPYAVAWAQSLRSIPVYGTTHADHLTRPVPCTPLMSDERIGGDYETETGHEIVAYFQGRQLSPVEVPMVLVGGHGPFTWANSAAKAVELSVTLEEIARMALLTEQLGRKTPLKESLIHKHWQRKHGEDSYYGQ